MTRTTTIRKAKMEEEEGKKKVINGKEEDDEEEWEIKDGKDEALRNRMRGRMITRKKTY